MSINDVIDSEVFSDELFLERLNDMQLTPTTLMCYLSRAFVNPMQVHCKPSVVVVEKILGCGESELTFDLKTWSKIFNGNIRESMPLPFHSAVNIATVIDDIEIVRCLLAAGAVSNDYTLRLVASPAVCKELLRAGAVPTSEDIEHLESLISAAISQRNKTLQEILGLLNHVKLQNNCTVS